MSTQLVQISEVSIDAIKNCIYEVRGQRVMIDRELAELYDVSTGRLNEAVKRNLARFPDDFMFRLDKEEWTRLKSQIAISKFNHMRLDISVVCSQRLHALRRHALLPNPLQ